MSIYDNYIKIFPAYAEHLLSIATPEAPAQVYSEVDGEMVLIDSVKGADGLWVKARATGEDVRELIRLTSELKILQDKINLIKADVQADADLTMANTACNSYAVSVSNGQVEVTNKGSIEILSGSKLRELLNDTAGEFITIKPETYSANAALSQVILALYTNSIERIGVPALIDEIGASCVSDGSLCFERTHRLFKKTFPANVKVFQGSFNMNYEDAVAAATRYSYATNYALVCKLAYLAGYYEGAVDKSIDEFITALMTYAIYTPTTAITIKTNE